jgi:hypothetical protein
MGRFLLAYFEDFWCTPSYSVPSTNWDVVVAVPAVPAVPAVLTVPAVDGGEDGEHHRRHWVEGRGQRAEGRLDSGGWDSITPFNYVLTWQLTTDSCSSQHVVTGVASCVLCPASCVLCPASCLLRPASPALCLSLLAVGV